MVSTVNAHSPYRPLAPLALAALLLAGCASVPDASPPPPAATAWQAPRPHQGQTAALADWWSRFDDPALPALVAAAQADSPTLAQAAARIRQARAAVQSAQGAIGPRVGVNAAATRSGENRAQQTPANTYATASADAQWEIDLFGGASRQRDAAAARLASGTLGWHDARVSLAAEVARQVVALRECEAVATVLDDDAASLRRVAGLTRQKVDVGFEAPSNGALADASAADAVQRARAQRASCDLGIKALVELTGQAEPALRATLAPRTGQIPRPVDFSVAEVPAQVLSQRPDLAAAAQDLVAAAADVGAADARRYPSLTLNGSIGLAGLRLGGDTLDGGTWSFGPALQVPLFDGGQRDAAVESARGRLDEQFALYRQKQRAAVREVETALVQLDAAAAREAQADAAARGYAAFLDAARQRWEVGTGSLIDLEDARRSALNARATLLGVQQARVSAWIALYKAVGGGWDASAAAPAAASVARSTANPPPAAR